MYFFKQVYSSNFRSQRPDVVDTRNSHVYLSRRMKKEKEGVLPMFTFVKKKSQTIIAEYDTTNNNLTNMNIHQVLGPRKL